MSEYTDKQLMSGLSQLEMMFQGVKYIKASLARHEEIQREIKAFEEEKGKRQALLDSLDAQKTRLAENVRGAQAKHNKAMADLAEKLKAKTDLVANMEKQAQDKQAQIDGLDAEYANRKKAKEAEIEAEQQVLDKIKADIERLKKRFAA